MVLTQNRVDELSKHLDLMEDPEAAHHLVESLRALKGEEPAREVHLGIGGTITPNKNDYFLHGRIVLATDFENDAALQEFLSEHGFYVSEGSVENGIYIPDNVPAEIVISTSRSPYLGVSDNRVELPSDYYEQIKGLHLLERPEFRVTELYFEVNDKHKPFAPTSLESHLQGLDDPAGLYSNYVARDRVIDGNPVMQGIDYSDPREPWRDDNWVKSIKITISPLDSANPIEPLPRNFTGLSDKVRFEVAQQWYHDLTMLKKGYDRELSPLATLTDVKL